jgi:hypothetical protein
VPLATLTFLLGGVASIRAGALSSIQVCSGVSLRIVRVGLGTVLLAAGSADPGRESGRSGTGGRVSVYVGSVLFQSRYVLGIPRRPAALGYWQPKEQKWEKQQSSRILHALLRALDQPILRCPIIVNRKERLIIAGFGGYRPPGRESGLVLSMISIW